MLRWTTAEIIVVGTIEHAGFDEVCLDAKIHVSGREATRGEPFSPNGHRPGYVVGIVLFWGIVVRKS